MPGRRNLGRNGAFVKQRGVTRTLAIENAMQAMHQYQNIDTSCQYLLCGLFNEVFSVSQAI
jgi:hypothetical protein